MVGQIDHRRSGGAGIKRDFEFAVVVPVVNDLGIQIARITLVAVGAQQREDDPVGFDPTVPQLIGKTGIPAVQMVSSVAVPRQAILLAVERKAAKPIRFANRPGVLPMQGPSLK